MLANPAGIGRLGEEFSDGRGPGRMPQYWGDFGQRNQNEIALQHPWVRHLQFRCINRHVTVYKNVQINQPRPFGERFLAAHLRFDAT